MRQHPRIILVFAVAVLAIPGFYVFVLKPAEVDPNDAVHYGSPAMQRLRKAQVSGDLQAMQEIMAGPDFEAAKLATTRLAAAGPEGARLMFVQLNSCSDDLKEAARRSTFNASTFHAAAEALRSGPEDARTGALIVVDYYIPQVSTNRGLSTPTQLSPANLMFSIDRSLEADVLDGLVRILPVVDKDQAVHMGELARRYGGATDSSLVELLDSPSSATRLAAVVALSWSHSRDVLRRLQLRLKDPDNAVRAAAKEAIPAVALRVKEFEDRARQSSQKQAPNPDTGLGMP